MEYALITAGIACLIAAIVGGGLKAFGIEIPQFASVRRQLLLGFLGMFLLGLGFHDRLSALRSEKADSAATAGNAEQASPENQQATNLKGPARTRSCGDATPLVARLGDHVHALAAPDPSNPAAGEARMAKLRLIAQALDLPPADMTASADDLRVAILRRITSEPMGRCAQADLEELIRVIEEQTGDAIP